MYGSDFVFQFDFCYWLFTFKFELEWYRVLARVRQASRRYPWVRSWKKWGRHTNGPKQSYYLFLKVDTLPLWSN